MIATMRVDVDRLAATHAGGLRARDRRRRVPRTAGRRRSATRTRRSAGWWCGAPSTTATCTRCPTTDLAAIDPHLTPDIRSVLSVAGALQARSTPGGTAPARVAAQLAAVRAELAGRRAWAAHRGRDPAAPASSTRGRCSRSRAPCSGSAWSGSPTRGSVGCGSPRSRPTRAPTTPARTRSAAAPRATRSCSARPGSPTSTSPTGCTTASTW